MAMGGLCCKLMMYEARMKSVSELERCKSRQELRGIGFAVTNQVFS
jgi:hypothetical protein